MNSKNSSKSTKDNSNIYKYILGIVVIAIVGYLIYILFLSGDETKYNVNTDPMKKIENIPEPQFNDEGDLQFLSKDKKVISKIDIEIADVNSERMQGLMYRKSMAEDRGMLFIFQNYEPQSFWMKNTIISLDIIFVDSTKQIVKIHKRTTPFSEKSLPSDKSSLYVVEVNAGYTDKYGIKEGDYIKF